MDAGLPFVQATYKLEGDGTLALECYEVISSLTTAMNKVPHYPNLQAVARCLSGGNQQIQQQLVHYQTKFGGVHKKQCQQKAIHDSTTRLRKFSEGEKVHVEVAGRQIAECTGSVSFLVEIG